MGFVETIDNSLESGMHVSPGTVILGLVMNVLCGRSPLYRVEEFYRMRDVELLLGDGMMAKGLNDDAIGRVLDRIHDYGTWKIFTEVCVRAFRAFVVDCSVVHQDTTSVSVWGEYRPSARDPVRIEHGYSKDKREGSQAVHVLVALCRGESSHPLEACWTGAHPTRRPTGRSSRSCPVSWRSMVGKISSM
jgi:transposase